MEYFLSILCLINGFVLGMLFMKHKYDESKKADITQDNKTSERLERQYTNFFGYNGSEKGQINIDGDDDEN